MKSVYSAEYEKTFRDSDVSEVLYELGATEKYLGHKYVVDVILMLLEDKSKMHRFIKGIYPDIAESYGVTPGSVERNIRTVVKKSYEINPELLDIIFGYELCEVPTATSFLLYLYKYVRGGHES